ncbi:uncharacterized protein B0H18DRAFT_976527 [Fomitopsis serialis]|uniref:uncharacterized protein n=1 Tax=Fomitopsis serialis TaxID=139415 RepID=UPI0020084B35|nr:uncharacterized protein B0H18DRAFT_976527 [Neoantrodia serialis]KAH9935619.1 hypothetical protein B0H18DRAFT_976527 [Neoantrodia serialis]
MIVCSLTRGVDWHTLRSCSLTCRAWLPISRAQLFHSIMIHDSGDLARLSKLLDASPYIGYYIRRFELNLANAPSPPNCCFLETILDHLPNVRLLALSGTFPCADSFVLPQMSTVSKLVLWGIWFDAVDDLPLLLASMPNARELDIGAIGMPDTVSPLGHPSQSRAVCAFNVRKLYVQRCPNVAAYPYLLSSPLHHLRIKLDDETQFKAFNALLSDSNAAETLNTLRLEVWDATLCQDEESPQWCKHLLKQCSALRHVHFSAHQSVLWVATVLSCAPSDLVTISIEGFARQHKDLERLADVLDCNVFHCLERVEMKFLSFSLLAKTISTEDVSPSGLQRVFGELHKRGKLVILRE